MFEDIRNGIDFHIRSKTRFSRKNFVEKNENLIERNRMENLYTKSVLESGFEKRVFSSVKVLDIGCKNWFYAKGEYEFFNSFCDEIFLDGVEIDAYRLYSNFYSRYEVAKYYTKGLKNTNYIVGNLLDLDDKYDYIIWFLPFVLVEPHQYWGLPKKYFYPEKLLEHAFNLLAENGQMLIINQGIEEFQVQKDLLNKLGIKYTDLDEIKNEFFEYKHKRYGVLVKK